jgi:hypothetical protein
MTTPAMIVGFTAMKKNFEAAAELDAETKQNLR